MTPQLQLEDEIECNTDLPSTAYHPTEDEFDYQSERVQKAELDSYPFTESSVTQLLRVAISFGGLQKGLDLAKKVTRYQLEYEEENVFSDFVVDRDRINNSNEPWLRTELNKLADERQEILNQEKKKYEQRKEWLTSEQKDYAVIPSIRKRLRSARDVINDGEFKQVVIFDDLDDIPDVLAKEHSDKTYHRGELSNEVDLSKFGVELPMKMLVCISSSGSVYPFVPWCGVTACTGPDKHASHRSTSTLCKHEIAALILESREDFNPDGIRIPERHRRLINGHEYTRFMNNIDQ
jgi:hypothetical protein